MTGQSPNDIFKATSSRHGRVDARSSRVCPILRDEKGGLVG